MDEGLRVQWRWGAWSIITAEGEAVLPADPGWLDAWLTAHGRTRADLDFADQDSLRQRFVFEFGPVD